MTLTSLTKPSGAVLIGRDKGSRSAALLSCMKEALSSSRLVPSFTLKETCSPVSKVEKRGE